MDDLISRQAAIRCLDTDRPLTIDGRGSAIGVVNYVNEVTWKLSHLPPVDAVPVVRCKDCINREPNYNKWCFRWGECVIGEMDFCSYGKAREDNAVN